MNNKLLPLGSTRAYTKYNALVKYNIFNLIGTLITQSYVIKEETFFKHETFCVLFIHTGTSNLLGEY